MKYTTLKSDIISILHSSDYELNIKCYNEEGQTTLQPNDVRWIYISNNNIMIELMNDTDSIIYIWKDVKNLDENMKTIIQRMRELAILNGVSVQIRVYNNLDQRKIYNLIKSSMEDSKEEEMKESVDIKEKLVEAFYGIISTAKNTKKPSDFYMSESILSQNYHSILSEMIEEISSIKGLPSLSVKKFLNPLYTITAKSEIEECVKNIPEKLSQKLYESLSNINNVSKYVANQYLQNTPFKVSPNTLLILENVKVYMEKDIRDNENLINAYNKLISLTEGVEDKIGLLRVIKNNKLDETYGVKKNELIDFWFNQDGSPIASKYNIVFENASGQKSYIDSSMKAGLNALANHLNENGSLDDSVARNIIDETVKYNDIASFIVEYKDNLVVRKYIPKFKKIFNETIKKLSSNADLKSLFESSSNDAIDYSVELNDLYSKTGVKHPALKYLAIVEARFNSIKSTILNEEKIYDMQLLVNEMKNYVPYSNVIASDIVENRLSILIPLKESKQPLLDIAKSIYQQVSNRPERRFTAVASTLFGIINSKKMTKSKEQFISTIIKYK
jgi:hypothetical protein